MISIESSGSFSRTDSFLEKLFKIDIASTLNRYGRQGVAILSGATPVESGLTANSWGYVVTSSGGSYTITWTNSHVVDGVPIAIILQYGHGTGTGGYVSGRNYINPAIQPIFDRLAEDVWKAVTSA